MITAMAVLLLVMAIIATATNSARSTMQRSTNEITAFAAARSAFETMSDKLSQATLNTYWDYYDSNGLSRGHYAASSGSASSFVPVTYGRASDLHFLVKPNTQKPYLGQEVYFQTPVAFSTLSTGASPPTYPYQDTQGLLNSCSFYVEYCPDSYRPSPLVPNANGKHWRYRLMEGIEPTESFSVYANVLQNLINAPALPSWTWFNTISNGGTTINPSNNVVPIADNVVCLIVWPRLPLRQDANGQTLTAPNNNYGYDSQGDIAQMFPAGHNPPQPLVDCQLPPIVQLSMVVIDEASAIRIATDTATEPTAISSAGPSCFSASNQTTFNTDLATFTTALAAQKINYRVFTAYVIMRESKWSQ